MPEPEPADVVAVDASPEQPRRRRTGAVAAVLVALVAVGTGVTWVATRGDGAGAVGAGICPSSMRTTTYDPDDPDGRRPADLVPATPTVPGLDGRLVPAADPSEIVLCEYRVPYRTFDRYPVLASADSNVPYGSSVADTPVPVPAEPEAVEDVPLGRTALHAAADPSVGPLLTALHAATVQTDGYYLCTFADFGTPGPQYLLRLTYDDGVVWVGGPASCTSTNGVESSVTDLSEPVSWALDHATATATGSPTTPTPPSVDATTSPVDPTPPSTQAVPSTLPSTLSPTLPSSSPNPDENDSFATCVPDGTPMQAESDPFVPFTPTSVLVCHAEVAGGPSTVVTRPAEPAVQLANTLNGLPPHTYDAGCPVIEHPEIWRLLFADDAGHTASVFVSAGACPEVDDKVKVAAPTPELFTQLGGLD